MKRISLFFLYSALLASSLHAQVNAPSLNRLEKPLAPSITESTEVASVLIGTPLNLRAAANTVAVLKSGTDGLGFYPASTITPIKANSAYVPEARQLLIDLSTLDSPLTSIQETEMEKGKLLNGRLGQGESYDLSGREVVKGKTPAGVIIQEKKKFVVKP